MVAPSTDIILYKSNLELDDLNQLKFNTWDDQWRYFSNLPHLYLENATYQRKEGVIRYPTEDIPYDELIRYNYVSYKNEAYSNKTFFAYVKSMKYVNDGMTEIEIETDVFQTWQFDIKYKKCFTEREHVKDDTFGKHTVPENVTTGEYMYQEITNTAEQNSWIENSRNDKFCVAVATSDTGFDPQDYGWGIGKTYNGVPNGFYYLCFPNSLELSNWINAMQSLPSNKTDAIYCMFVCYQSIAQITDKSYKTIEWRGIDFHCALAEPSIQDEIKPTFMRTKYFTDKRILGNSYKPVNNKLLCYPYRFITISNNAGQTNQYRYEYFARNHSYNVIEFSSYATLSPGLNIKLVPDFYNKTEWDIPISSSNDYSNAFANFSEGLDGPKLPMCGWNTDAFLNWLSQNGVNLIGQTAINVGEIIGGAALMASGGGAPYGGMLATTGFTGIAGTMIEGAKAKLEPDTAKGGANSGTLNFACKRLFTPYLMSIRDEYAKIIDDYFTMFGYKVNSLKVPEIHSRENWNYVKTVDCNFAGDIPGDDLVKIRGLFNRGITIWHNPNTFLDYSQRNRILS